MSLETSALNVTVLVAALPNITSPSTVKVEFKLVAPSTSKVPAVAVLPVAASTVNLFVFTLKLPVTLAVDPTSRVPVVLVFPVATVTANVLLILKLVPSNVKFASSSNEPFVPAITILLSVKSLTVAVEITTSPILSGVILILPFVSVLEIVLVSILMLPTSSDPTVTTFPVAQSIVNLFKPSPNKKSPFSSICNLCTPSVQKSKSLLLAPGLVSATMYVF